MSLEPIERLFTFDYEDDDQYEYVVLASGEKTLWYLVDLACEIWVHLEPRTSPYE